MSGEMGASYLSSPDMQSSVFPDRLIRPLPKRSLRSRLSQEAAEAIPFPPNPPSSRFPADNQYGEHGEYASDNKVLVQQDEDCCEHDPDQDHHYHHHHHCHDHGQDHENYHHRHQDEGYDLESIEDDDRKLAALRTTIGYRELSASQRAARSSRHAAIKAVYSGSDGYDAFENTNNKKKRKIPTSGSIGLHQSSLSVELAHLGLDGSRNDSAVAQDDGAADGQYQAPASHTGNTLSGTSRSRHGKDLGRRTSARNPLSVSTSNSNVRPGAFRGNPMQDDLKATDQGIISAAIANATALLRKPLQKGQENIGVLEQQQQQKSSPTNTQFTFTCETEAAKGVTFPEQSLYSAGYAQRASNMPNSNSSNGQVSTTHGAYTNSGMQSGRGRYPQSTASQGAQHPNAQGTKPRRRRGDVYTLAARQRRLQQEYANLHHPPGPEDVWICEFCEYESIFGVPPMALIRQYEIKDRKERKRLAEKRRLLEKAKMKGRKGKKQTKNAAKAANGVNQQPLNQQAYDQQPLDQVGRDGYLDDVYDDDSIPLPAPPPAPLKQPMPGAYDATMGRYAAAGNSGKGAGGG